MPNASTSKDKSPTRSPGINLPEVGDVYVLLSSICSSEYIVRVVTPKAIGLQSRDMVFGFTTRSDRIIWVAPETFPLYRGPVGHVTKNWFGRERIVYAS